MEDPRIVIEPTMDYGKVNQQLLRSGKTLTTRDIEEDPTHVLHV